jgi:hypothetical protein
LSLFGLNGVNAAKPETTRNWTILYDLLDELAGEVHPPHPLEVKTTAEARIKTDKIDSEVPGHLLRCDLLPEADVPSQAARDVRNILRQRLFSVRLHRSIVDKISKVPAKPRVRNKKAFVQDMGAIWRRA